VVPLSEAIRTEIKLVLGEVPDTAACLRYVLSTVTRKRRIHRQLIRRCESKLVVEVVKTMRRAGEIRFRRKLLRLTELVNTS